MSRELHKAIEKLSDNVEKLTENVGKMVDNQSTVLEMMKPFYSQFESMMKDLENNFPWPGAFNRGPLVRDSELKDEEKSLRGNEKSLDEKVADLRNGEI